MVYDAIVAGKVLRRVQTLCVALRAVRNSPVHNKSHDRGTGTLPYAIFQTVLRDHLKKKSRYNTWFISVSKCSLFYLQ